MSKAKKILSLISKGKTIKEAAKATKSSEAYVYYVRWADKKGKATPKKAEKKAVYKSDRSKIVQAAFQAKREIEAVKAKKDTKDDWQNVKVFWDAMKNQYGDSTSEVMDQLVDPKPVFGEITATSDLVNHPPHYKAGGIETIDFIEAKDLNYRLGNVVKYVSRAGKKLNSDPVQDLEKAMFYLKREIEARKGA